MCPYGNWPHNVHSAGGNSDKAYFGPDLTEALFRKISLQLEKSGFYVAENFLLDGCVKHWLQMAEDLDTQNQFRESEVGKKEHTRKNSTIRSDRIFWIDNEEATKDAFFWLNSLFQQLKDHFRVPLQDIESHLSIFPEGSHYSKHVDNPKGLSPRLFTFIFYLNPHWQIGDGGELVVYDPQDISKELFRVAPKGGTFVLFRSDIFYHEVLQAKKSRYALTGWMRRSATP